MRRMWISLVVLLWLGTYVVGAEERTRGLRQSPRRPDAPASAEKRADAAAAAATAESEAPETSSASAGSERRATGGAIAFVPAGDGEHRHTRVVARLKAVPANELVNTILQVLHSEGRTVPTDSARRVVIVPSAASNSLVISGLPEAVIEVQKLVEELDHPAPMVRLRVTLGEVPVEKANQDPAKTPSPEAIRQQMEILAEVQLTTLDNQAAQVHMGRREPRITASHATQAGRMNSVSYENTGTIMKITPRVSSDGTVTVELEVEDSRLGPGEEGAAIAESKEGELTRAANTEMVMVRTVLRIPDGQTIVAGGSSRQANSGNQRWVLVTPQVISPGQGG